jgi:hypothetical protein
MASNRPDQPEFAITLIFSPDAGYPYRFRKQAHCVVQEPEKIISMALRHCSRTGFIPAGSFKANW